MTGPNFLLVASVFCIHDTCFAFTFPFHVLSILLYPFTFRLTWFSYLLSSIFEGFSPNAKGGGGF